MTAKRGTLWKTSWRRQKPAIGAGQRVPMWFFSGFTVGQNGQAFQQPLTSPSIGDVAPPFWVGTIQGNDLLSATATSSIVGRGTAWFEFLEWKPTSNLLQVNTGATTSMNPAVSQLNPPLSPIQVRAVVQMLVVEPYLAGFRATLWIDGAVRASTVSAVAYVPGASLLGIEPSKGLFNSLAGGNALPTTQEIQDWFSATRYAPQPAAQAIPGKTSDRYDAGITPGVVPDPLINQAGGQAAPLVPFGLPPPPLPANILLDATFGY